MLIQSMNRLLGRYFTATDKLGRTYNYRVIGIDLSCKMRMYILWNLTTHEQTEVEREWFNQRTITNNHN